MNNNDFKWERVDSYSISASFNSLDNQVTLDRNVCELKLLFKDIDRILVDEFNSMLDEADAEYDCDYNAFTNHVLYEFFDIMSFMYYESIMRTMLEKRQDLEITKQELERIYSL